MRKLLAIGMLFTCIWAVNAQAGIYRHALKPAAKGSVKIAKFSGKAAVQSVKVAKKVIY